MPLLAGAKKNLAVARFDHFSGDSRHISGVLTFQGFFEWSESGNITLTILKAIKAKAP